VADVGQYAPECAAETCGALDYGVGPTRLRRVVALCLVSWGVAVWYLHYAGQESLVFGAVSQLLVSMVSAVQIAA
jgi:hypothetical protein